MKPLRNDESTLLEGGKVAPRPFLLQEFKSFNTADVEEEIEDAADEMPEQEPEVIPPGIRMTEEEFAAALQAAERKGREEGLLQGKQEGMDIARQEMARAEEAKAAEVQAALQTTAEALVAKLEADAEMLQSLREGIRAEMSGIVLAMGRKLAGQALQTQPLGAVQDMIEQCVEMFTGPMKVSITIAEPLVEPLKQFMEFRMRDGVQMEIKGNPQMVAGDCQVDWPGGGAKRNQQEIEREIEAIILRGLAGKTES